MSSQNIINPKWIRKPRVTPPPKEPKLIKPGVTPPTFPSPPRRSHIPMNPKIVVKVPVMMIKAEITRIKRIAHLNNGKRF